jgi:hypothetical protein
MDSDVCHVVFLLIYQPRVWESPWYYQEVWAHVLQTVLP